MPSAEGEEGLQELAELLRTAGVGCVGELVQHREQPHPNTYIGPGKLIEAKALASACDANLIACDDELSPRQERNLERELGLPVVDRTTVILDIFAAHASTAEGKLQVELAQLEYNLARMRGLWSHLERLGGGIGTRGPGESQIETDRRLARDRISALRRRLEHVKSSRAVMRAERERAELPQIALVGYTNVGKSTMLNALTHAFGEAAQPPRNGNGRGGGEARRRGPSSPLPASVSLNGEVTVHASVGDRLFHTLDPTTRTLRIGGRRHLLTDTVGFIRKLPHQLIDAFGATLEETVRAELLLHVMDASVPERRFEEMKAAVERTLDEIGAGETPRVLVCNKADLIDENRLHELLLGHPDAVIASASSGAGLEQIAEALTRELQPTLRSVDLLVPYRDARKLAELHELAGNLDRMDTPEGVRVRALLPARLAQRYDRFAVV